MLPTLGLFRIVPCPYYIAGLCDRPNCCFRHCRSDVEAARREAAGLDVADKDESEPEDAETPSVSAVDNKPSTDPPKVLNSPTLESFQIRSRFNEEGQEKATIRIKSFDSLTLPASTNSVSFEDKKLFGISNPPSKLFISNDGASLKRPNDSTSDGEIGNNIKRIKLEEQEPPQRSTFCNIKTEKTDLNVSKKSFDDDDDDVIILSSGSEGGSPEKPEKQIINIKLEKPDDSKPSTKSHKSRDRDSDRSSKDSGCDKPHSRKSDEHRTNSSSSSSSHKNKKDRKDSRPSSSHSSRHSGEVRRSSDSSSKSTSKHKDKDKSKEPHPSSSKRSHSSKDKKSHSAKHSSKQEKSRESSKSHNHHKKNGNCSENANSTSNGDSKTSKHKNKIESRKSSSSVGENVKDDEEIGMRRSSLTLSYNSFHDDGDGDDNLSIFEPVDNDNDADHNADDFLFPSDEEDDPDEIAAECFQLFQEYKSDDSSVQAVSLETVPEPFLHRPADLESDPFGKKRVAHAGAIRSFLEKPLPPKRKETANEQLIKRMQQAKASAVENANNSNNVNTSFGYSQNHPVPPSVVSTSSVGGANLPNKRRIAHCSNASALVKPPQAPQSRTTPGGFPSSSSALQPARNANGINSAFSSSTSFTTSQTVAKGERRQAHTPVVNNINSAGPSPTIIPDSRSKVPVVIRQKFLDQIYRECLQVYTDRETASTRALEEEKGLIAKCNSKQVYSCSATNLITRLRKQYRESTSEIGGGGFATAGSTKTVSHNDILAGKSGNISWSVEKTKTVSNPVGVPLYTRMKDYLMSASELIDNGYPRKCAETYRGCSGIAVIKVREDSSAKRTTADDPLRKVCDRCSVSFLVTEEGFPRTKETCTYHTGRRFGRRTRTGNSDTRYNCCDGEPNSIGCCTAPCHVFTTKTADDFRNFISAALEAGDADTMGTHPWDIIAVDCEMVYTTHGTELARATFVGQDGKILYDTYVKPSHPVLDYNTRYSGIDASMIENTMTSISEVHLKILANLRPNSIIIGHSLENDLIALKLIHGCVIDTSLVYPHKRGLPFKRALRNLSSDYLGKIIQTGDAGHDSAEDARAALDLVLWKVKSDASKFAKRLSVSEQP